MDAFGFLFAVFFTILFILLLHRYIATEGLHIFESPSSQTGRRQPSKDRERKTKQSDETIAATEGRDIRQRQVSNVGVKLSVSIHEASIRNGQHQQSLENVTNDRLLGSKDGVFLDFPIQEESLDPKSRMVISPPTSSSPPSESGYGSLDPESARSLQDHQFSSQYTGRRFNPSDPRMIQKPIKPGITKQLASNVVTGQGHDQQMTVIKFSDVPKIINLQPRTRDTFIDKSLDPFSFTVDRNGCRVETPYAEILFPCDAVSKRIEITVRPDYSRMPEKLKDVSRIYVSPEIYFESKDEMKFNYDVTISLEVMYSAIDPRDPITLQVERNEEGVPESYFKIQHGIETRATFKVKEFCGFSMLGETSELERARRHFCSIICLRQPPTERPKKHYVHWYIYDNNSKNTLSKPQMIKNLGFYILSMEETFTVRHGNNIVLRFMSNRNIRIPNSTVNLVQFWNEPISTDKKFTIDARKIDFSEDGTQNDDGDDSEQPVLNYIIMERPSEREVLRNNVPFDWMICLPTSDIAAKAENSVAYQANYYVVDAMQQSLVKEACQKATQSREYSHPAIQNSGSSLVPESHDLQQQRFGHCPTGGAAGGLDPSNYNTSSFSDDSLEEAITEFETVPQCFNFNQPQSYASFEPPSTTKSSIATNKTSIFVEPKPSVASSFLSQDSIHLEQRHYQTFPKSENKFCEPVTTLNPDQKWERRNQNQLSGRNNEQIHSGYSSLQKHDNTLMYRSTREQSKSMDLPPHLYAISKEDHQKNTGNPNHINHSYLNESKSDTAIGANNTFQSEPLRHQNVSPSGARGKSAKPPSGNSYQDVYSAKNMQQPLPYDDHIAHHTFDNMENHHNEHFNPEMRSHVRSHSLECPQTMQEQSTGQDVTSRGTTRSLSELVQNTNLSLNLKKQPIGGSVPTRAIDERKRERFSSH